ncbi:MAG TPA: hypothetical protein VFA18_04050 [Gemmataceae bacterium]|nr:hypothetical protein [Gemmataceae bacterium]
MTHFRSCLAASTIMVALTALVFAGETKSAGSKKKCCCEAAGCPGLAPCCDKTAGTAAENKCTGCCTKCANDKATGAAEASEDGSKAAGCCETCKKNGQKNCCCKTSNDKQCCGTCDKNCPGCAATCNKTVVRVYNIGDLLAGSKECCANDMVRVITGVIQTASWECNGGSGAVEYFPGTQCLVIRQTQAVQQEVNDLLASLRSAGRSNQPQTLSFNLGFPGGQLTAACAATPMAGPCMVCGHGVTGPCVAGGPGAIAATLPCPSCRSLVVMREPAASCAKADVVYGYAPCTGPCPMAFQSTGLFSNPTPVPPPPAMPTTPRCLMEVAAVCFQTPDGYEKHLAVQHAGGSQMLCDSFSMCVAGCKPIKISMSAAPAKEGIVQAAAHSEAPGQVEICCGSLHATATRVEQAGPSQLSLSGNVSVSTCPDGAHCNKFLGSHVVLTADDGQLKVTSEGNGSGCCPTGACEGQCHDPLAYLIWSSMFGGW